MPVSFHPCHHISIQEFDAVLLGTSLAVGITVFTTTLFPVPPITSLILPEPPHSDPNSPTQTKTVTQVETKAWIPVETDEDSFKVVETLTSVFTSTFIISGLSVETHTISPLSNGSVPTDDSFFQPSEDSTMSPTLPSGLHFFHREHSDIESNLKAPSSILIPSSSIPPHTVATITPSRVVSNNLDQGIASSVAMSGHRSSEIGLHSSSNIHTPGFCNHIPSLAQVSTKTHTNTPNTPPI
ncbi:hypothetical protein NP233_g1249 [Leucocoprinus birnbaumii]|uniref:Uncharacterized protein n=1 Tax=Leucocoprinus birnbaumii TaxID=56174 RepID=A0AAD5W5S7_9AGAR|nr:hypothetical protein NP233_g1249 [Leucocoprinus birnbaumii]